jgi:MoaA/NifB/PqqE/SkfB family radical SAM enzyme
MRELPNVVPLAARLGVEEVIFTHLDYLPDERWNILRTFYHESPTPAFQESIDEIRRLGNRMGVGVKTYPLKAEEVLVCEPNPPRNVFFSVDGSVTPCPYLRIPKKGDIPRIFMHKEYRVPQTFFGNINHEDFLEVWNKESYKKFREIFEERSKAGMEGSSGLRPLSELCRTCYKAYEI